MFILKIVSLGWLLRQIVIHEIRRLSELPISYPPSLFPFAYLTPCCISSSLVCVHVCMWVHVCCWQGWFFSYSMSKLSFTLSWLSGFLLWPISRPFLPACLPSSGWSSSLGVFFLSGRTFYMCTLSLSAEERTCQTDRWGDYWLPLDMESDT